MEDYITMEGVEAETETPPPSHPVSNAQDSGPTPRGKRGIIQGSDGGQELRKTIRIR